MCTNWNEYEVSKCTNSQQIFIVDAMPETASPGPMIVYALTTVFNSSVDREVPQCELCGWCVGVVQYSSAVVGDLIHCDDTIRLCREQSMRLWAGLTPWVADRPVHWNRNYYRNIVLTMQLWWSVHYSLSCSDSTVRAVLYSPDHAVYDCSHLHRASWPSGVSSVNTCCLLPSPILSLYGACSGVGVQWWVLSEIRAGKCPPLHSQCTSYTLMC